MCVFSDLGKGLEFLFQELWSKGNNEEPILNKQPVAAIGTIAVD